MRSYFVYLAVGLGLMAPGCRLRQENALGEGTSYHVGAGYPQRFRLPDGSSVVVSPETSVSIAKGFGKDNRDIDLDGEAVFEVVGGAGAARPFVLHTRDLVVEVVEAGRFHAEAS